MSIGDDTTDWSNVAKNVANLESFAGTSCGYFDKTAFESLVNGSTNLKHLKTDLHAYQFMEFEDVAHWSCGLLNIPMLQKLFRQYSKLTKISCRFPSSSSFDFENVQSLFELISCFSGLQSLREVDLKYNYFHFNSSEFSYSGPILHRIQSLTLRNVLLEDRDVQAISQTMPSISKLAFFGIAFYRESAQKDRTVAANFLAAITTFSDLNYFTNFFTKSGNV